MPFYYFDSTWIVLLPAMLLALYAQYKVKSTFSKYSKVKNYRGLTGYDVAKQILDDNGLYDTRIEQVKGSLTDHYDPRENVVRLSESVYASTSVAALGVAAHECGHAVQHATNYAPIRIRSAIVSVTGIASNAGVMLIFVGLLLSSYTLAMIGVVLFSVMAVFQLVTLPVEFNASSRAIKTLENRRILEDDELSMARKVLSAAALTYVAALISTLATILRFLLIIGSRNNRRN